ARGCCSGLVLNPLESFNPRNTCLLSNSPCGFPTSRKPSGISSAAACFCKVSTLRGSRAALYSYGRALKNCLRRVCIGVTVQVDSRTNNLKFDLQYRGRRRRFFGELPDTPKNRTIVEAKAQTIDREMFLGIFDPAHLFPKAEEKRRITFRRLYEEW